MKYKRHHSLCQFINKQPINYLQRSPKTKKLLHPINYISVKENDMIIHFNKSCATLATNHVLVYHVKSNSFIMVSKYVLSPV